MTSRATRLASVRERRRLSSIYSPATRFQDRGSNAARAYSDADEEPACAGAVRKLV
jgi:hypothetical protein